MEKDVGYPGNDITSYRNIKTWHSCSRHCFMNAECKYWTWNAKLNTCYMKSDVTKRETNIGKISGSKICGNECKLWILHSQKSISAQHSTDVFHSGQKIPQTVIKNCKRLTKTQKVKKERKRLKIKFSFASTCHKVKNQQ